MKKTLVLIITVLGSFLIFANVNSNANDLMTGKLTYQKSNNSGYVKNPNQVIVYNHVPNSKYQNIKQFNLKKVILKNKTLHLKFNLMASQATQYNWYRFTLKKGNISKTYWIYGSNIKLNE